MIGTNNLHESIEFYDRVMPLLGYSRQATGETFAGYGKKDDDHTGKNCLWIGKPFNGEPATAGNGVNIALLARNRDQVKEFYKSAVEAGAVDEGSPGIRDPQHIQNFTPPIYVTQRVIN